MLPVFVALLLAAGTPPVVAQAQLDLLADQDWSHFAGATRTAGGVQIRPLDRWIVSTEGKRSQPNPPVNLLGPRLLVNGTFQVDAVMAGAGSLQLYGSPPIIYDEWRQEPPSVRVGVTAGRLDVAVWNGKSDKPVQDKKFGSGLSGDVAVRVKRSGSALEFSADGRQLGTLPDPGVFSSGQVWFGADGAWRLKSLTATGATGIRKAPEWKQKAVSGSLRARAEALPRKVGVGSALAIAPLVADDQYRATAGEQFDLVTPENDMKPQFVQPARGVFAFEEADAIVDFAQANDIAVHAHTLVWFEALPTWMRSAPDRKTVMTDHIKAVAGHFGGRVTEWDVVNEPMNEDNADGLEHNLWYEAMGADYIAQAFRAARSADPDAVLYLNEYGAEAEGPRWKALHALVKKLRQDGVPIDGVGLQSHEYEASDRVPAETFRKHVRELAELGLKVRVSEMDVVTSDQTLQAKQFGERLAVCRQEASCTGFTSWGFTDRYGSTASANRYPPVPGNALPWSASITPKKAYTAMADALR
jgi:endo-1,4-beta-xylanase